MIPLIEKGTLYAALFVETEKKGEEDTNQSYWLEWDWKMGSRKMVAFNFT